VRAAVAAVAVFKSQVVRMRALGLRGAARHRGGEAWRAAWNPVPPASLAVNKFSIPATTIDTKNVSIRSGSVVRSKGQNARYGLCVFLIFDFCVAFFRSLQPVEHAEVTEGPPRHGKWFFPIRVLERSFKSFALLKL